MVYVHTRTTKPKWKAYKAIYNNAQQEKGCMQKYADGWEKTFGKKKKAVKK